MKLGPVEWEQTDASDETCQECGIASIAYQEVIDGEFRRTITVGYNGILKGTKVLCEGKPYTIVMVSRLGDFGLSETGALPYTKRVPPNAVSPLVPPKE